MGTGSSRVRNQQDQQLPQQQQYPGQPGVQNPSAYPQAYPPPPVYRQQVYFTSPQLLVEPAAPETLSHHTSVLNPAICNVEPSSAGGHAMQGPQQFGPPLNGAPGQYPGYQPQYQSMLYPQVIVVSMHAAQLLIWHAEACHLPCLFQLLKWLHNLSLRPGEASSSQAVANAYVNLQQNPWCDKAVSSGIIMML